jgi:hypothetical protein
MKPVVALSFFSPISFTLAAATSLLVAPPAFSQDAQFGHGQPDPPMGGIVWHRDHVAKPGGGGGSPDLVYHGGPVEGSVVVTPIFWGTSWTAADEKIAGLKQFYAGLGGTAYAGTSSEYSDNSGTNFGGGVSFDGTVRIDNNAAPKHGPRTSTIQAEVCAMISNPVTNGYYPVYIDQPRAHAGYCAWHSWGSCNGVNIQFGFFFNLDGDQGCDAIDLQSGHSQGLASLANVSGHEISEAVTDPRGTGWFDSSGAENADKCAWTFGGNLVAFKNGTSWKIQGNYSNAAAALRSGYDGAGCIDGN